MKRRWQFLVHCCCCAILPVINLCVSICLVVFLLFVLIKSKKKFPANLRNFDLQKSVSPTNKWTILFAFHCDHTEVRWSKEMKEKETINNKPTKGVIGNKINYSFKGRKQHHATQNIYYKEKKTKEHNKICEMEWEAGKIRYIRHTLQQYIIHKYIWGKFFIELSCNELNCMLL